MKPQSNTSIDAALPRAVVRAPAQPKVVLLADDNATVRQLVARILRRNGFRVIEQEDGQAALDALLAQADKVDLALLDSIMPGLKGEQVLAALRARGINMPVILISAYSAEDLDIEADRNEYFLPKPFRPWELLNLLTDAFEHQVDSNSR